MVSLYINFTHVNTTNIFAAIISAGAMRLPSTPDEPNKIHFLTDYYGEELFKLEMIDFINSNENGFLKFYNKPRVQHKGMHKYPKQS